MLTHDDVCLGCTTSQQAASLRFLQLRVRERLAESTGIAA
jgi:hypothetical protein